METIIHGMVGSGLLEALESPLSPNILSHLLTWASNSFHKESYD